MTLSTAQRLGLAWFVLAGLAVALLWWLGPVLTPFLVAGALAYLLHPAVQRLSRPVGALPRLLAVALVELAALFLALGVLLLIVPILSRELPLLRDQIPVLATRINEQWLPWLNQLGISVRLDTAGIKAFAIKHLGANLDDWLVTVLASARIGGSLLLTLLGNAVLVPVVLFYLLADWPGLVQRVKGLIPPRWRTSTEALLKECDDMLGHYLRGQLMVMGALALYYTLALALAGFELALPVGVFTGLAIFVPYLGFGLGAALALLAGVLQFSSWYGVTAVLLIYGVGQVVESFILTPRLVGERIGLHPIAVIFVLLAFGHLFGFVGVLLALPLGALSLVLLRRLRSAYLASPLFGP